MTFSHSCITLWVSHSYLVKHFLICSRCSFLEHISYYIKAKRDVFHPSFLNSVISKHYSIDYSFAFIYIASNIVFEERLLFNPLFQNCIPVEPFLILPKFHSRPPMESLPFNSSSSMAMVPSARFSWDSPNLLHIWRLYITRNCTIQSSPKQHPWLLERIWQSCCHWFRAYHASEAKLYEEQVLRWRPQLTMTFA